MAAMTAKPRQTSSSGSSPLEECMRMHGAKAAWDMLDAMRQAGQPFTRFTISRLLMKTVAEGRGPGSQATLYRGIEAVECFMLEHPDEADEVLFNALLDACYHVKDLPRLEAALRRMEELKVEPSHVTLGILVKAFGQAGDVARVMNLWDKMAEQRDQANAVTHGCMIDACVRCGRQQKAIEIFQDMKSKKKHRNTILYTTLIKGYGLESDLRGALALFREMKGERVPYNRITYNSIIDVCIKCNDVQAAENLFGEMTAPGSGVEPDLITFSTLLKGYCHIGDLDKALQVAETMKANGLRCDELVYNTLMDGCVRANDLSAGIGLLAELVRSGLTPSPITFSILVRLYQKGGGHSAAAAADAVCRLYEHHGLPRPSAPPTERRGRGRRGGRQANVEKPRHAAGATSKAANSAPLGMPLPGTQPAFSSAAAGTAPAAMPMQQAAGLTQLQQLQQLAAFLENPLVPQVQFPAQLPPQLQQGIAPEAQAMANEAMQAAREQAARAQMAQAQAVQAQVALATYKSIGLMQALDFQNSSSVRTTPHQPEQQMPNLLQQPDLLQQAQGTAFPVQMHADPAACHFYCGNGMYGGLPVSGFPTLGGS